MSGLAAIVDSAHPPRAHLERVLDRLAWRGEEAIAQTVDPACAIGARVAAGRLASRALVVSHPDSGCVAVGDVRLDDRSGLATLLGVDDAEENGDLDLVVLAYLRFGEACTRHLLGDFAFAIRNPRTNSLFAARDHMGMKPLHYAQPRPGLLVIASDARAVTGHPAVPGDFDRRRIGDFLEIRVFDDDRSLTFFEAVKRLPAAHSLTFDDRGLRIRRYWTLEPGSPSAGLSAADHAETFRKVFGEAVKARLRGAGTIGIMLSGGIDSGAVAAMAQSNDDADLRGYSLIDGEDPSEIETRMIALLSDHLGLPSTRIDWQTLGGASAELAAEFADMEEPYDWEMVMQRALYRRAARDGVRVMLDGVGGDTAFAPGDMTARLLRRGKWREAWRREHGRARFYGGNPWRELAGAGFRALAPLRLRQWKQHVERLAMRLAPARGSLATPDFAAPRIAASVARAKAHPRERIEYDLPAQRAAIMTASHVSAAREVYERAAARYGIEARDPWSDIRVLQLLVDLPPDQVARSDWPKYLLRKAMEPLLPAPFVWRRGKQHLAWPAIVRFNEATGFPPGNELPFPDFVRIPDKNRSNSSWDTMSLRTLTLWLERNDGMTDN